MSHDTGPNGTDADLADLADLAGRRDALRQAAGLPGADPRTLLDAAFAELDIAVEVLAKLVQAGTGEPDAAAGAPASVSAERSLLRAVFQQAPAALFLLDPDGTIRRANNQAGELIGAPPGYATGKPLTAFADVASRAAVRSQFAAVAQTGVARQARCTLLGPEGPSPATLTVSALESGARLLVVAVSGVGHDGPQSLARPPGPGDLAGAPSRDDISATTRRMDTVTAVTRLLLDNSTFSEAVTLQRCARLLAGEIAAWVVVDVERAGELRRQFVIGPHGEQAEELARKARGVDPPPESVPAQVHVTGRAIVLAHVDDAGVLGAAPDGTPLLMLFGGTSLISVPISDGGTGYGVLTLARQPAEGRFGVADLALATELGEHLGVAIRVDRMFRHRSAQAEALQGSLLPSSLPEVPGLELSAAYTPASEGPGRPALLLLRRGHGGAQP